MSIKISCDQKTSLFSISLSSSRDVVRKRLKFKKLTSTTTISSIMIEKSTNEIKRTSQLYNNNNNNYNDIINNNNIKLKSINIKNQLTKITDNSKFNNLNNNNNSINKNNYNITIYCLYHIILLLLFSTIHIVRPTNALLIVEPTSLSDGILLVSNSEQEIINTGTKSNDNNNNNNNLRNNNNNNGNNNIGSIGNGGTSNSNINTGSGHYLDKLDNLERSLAAVLIKVAYGTTSTTKRSIPDNSYIPSLTTIATPPLTTLRYSEKSPHQQQINLHHRNYELDLERDHALPTSAPNADILKSNSNPTYPNPNRHHNHDRDRHRHTLNSTPAPSIHNLLKKGQPTIPMYPGDIPSYSPPARAFFTPPLPPEYQNPFADKPTLRGTNNDGGIINNPGNGNNGGSITNNNGNSGTNGNGAGGGNPSYINRRPIPPPSLMPGHERIPYRPPELGGQNIGSDIIGLRGVTVGNGLSLSGSSGNYTGQQRKKALNTPSQKGTNKIDLYNDGGLNSNSTTNDAGNSDLNNMKNSGRVHIPNISRILSGSNGKKEDIPDVLLQQVTNRPDLIGITNKNKYSNINQNKYIENSKSLSTIINNHDIIIDDTLKQQSSEEDDNDDDDDNFDDLYNIQKNQNHNNQDEPKTQLTIKMSIKSTENPININNNSTQIIHNLLNNDKNFVTSSSSSSPPSGILSTYNQGNIINGHESIATAAAASLPNNNNNNINNKDIIKNNNGNIIGKNNNIGNNDINSKTILSSSTTLTTTWDIAWNIHIYLSVILFTILGVYSIFKIIFYNKLTHLFNQSYFICINIILISICIIRIFYLIYDAYNINSTFNILISELLLNLPSIFLTITFSILILFLLIRSLNHKNNRYSSLIRPLTVVVGSSVHVGLCITLHYVENYTTNNLYNHYYYQQQLHQQQFIQLQQQQQLLQQQQHQQLLNNQNQQNILYRSINGINNNNNNNNDGIISTSNSNSNSIINNIGRSSLPIQTQPPPRVLSLICQIIYIFVCLSLGLLYLYIYRLLKRVLRSKSQNYIHGYQNLSYAIHITIATALLFILLAALQIFGAISISTTRTLNINGILLEIDWLQWGYQFSLRLIEISIIWLIGWVAGLKTGGGNNNGNNIGNSLGNNNSNNTNNILKREKSNCSGGGGGGNDNRNISGFALFPCTSSSSQENFETDYPAICNANTNLHTYTKRTGKPIYDDNFTLNSIQNNCNTNNIQSTNNQQQQRVLSNNNDFHQLQNNTDYVRSYDTNSLRSDHHHHHHHHRHHQQHNNHNHHHNNSQLDNEFIGDDDNDDNINNGGAGGGGIIDNNGTVDHYENPNFELRCSKLNYHYQQQQEQNQIDNCYSEPLNLHGSNNSNSSSTAVTRNNQNYDQGYDFQNFERPHFQDRSNSRSSCGNNGNNNSIDIEYHYNNNHHYNNGTINKQKHTIKLDRSADNNTERRSSNSTHSCTSGRGGVGINNINNGINSIDCVRYPIYNSFERRSNGVRKSGTLNNIGGSVHGRNGSSSSSSSVSNQQQHNQHHRPSGVQTLSSGHRNSSSGGGGGGGGGVGAGIINSTTVRNGILNNQNGIVGSNSSSSSKGGSSNGFYRNGNSTISFQQQQQYKLPSDDEMILIANSSASERTNLLNNHCNSDGTTTTTNCIDGGITSSISGGNLTDITTTSGGGGSGIGSVALASVNNGVGGSGSSSGESANSGSMLVAEHGFVRFRALDDINNAQGVGIHNASIRTTGRSKEKRYTNNT